MILLLTALVNGLILLATADLSGPICNFAPLCGSRNATWEILPDPQSFPVETDGILIGGATIEFTDCCSLRDTVPVQDCEIVNPSGNSERFATSFTPICDADPENCEEGTCEDYQLVFQPVFERSNEPDGCCDTCKCFGDPQCVSFSGVENMWLLCDGREVPTEEDHHKRCRITEEVCNSQIDHDGRTCHYKHWNKNGKYWNLKEKGSPCVPNPESPPSVITMYEVPSQNFKIDLTQGERGTISDVYLKLNCGTFTLNALECLTDDDEGWKIIEGDLTELPEAFHYKKLVDAEDVIWDIIDPDSGIAINIRCYGNAYDPEIDSSEPEGGVWMPRINVESLSEPSVRPDGSGYCVSSEFNYGPSTTDHTDYIESGQLCVDGLEEFSVLQIYREICRNPALPQSGIEDCSHSFCSVHFAPLYSNPGECVEALKDSLRDGFCNAIVYVPGDVGECLEAWDDFGAIVTIKQYYEDISGCTSEYLTVKPDCQGGVMLQYLNEDGVWVDVIFVPEDYCGEGDDGNGHIILNKCDHEEVFTRPVRFVQNSVDASCGPVNQCKRIDGFTGFVALNIPPTPYPSTSPTTSPTPYPTTGSPTPGPSVSPSPYPTTESPTPEPTPYPTDFPTEENIPPSPVCEYDLCETEATYLPIGSSGMVHTTMDSCCPPNVEDVCPQIEPEELNRKHGTNQPFCGSKFPGATPFKNNCANSDKLELQVSFLRNADVECCLTCVCYGDPRCYAFDGTFDEFIICDGRAEPESGRIDDRCIIKKDTCEEQRDHRGNPCAWANPYVSTPDFNDPYQQALAEQNFDVVQYGSPCQYNEELSGPSTILLYEVPNYRLLVEQFDRGYMNAIYLTTDLGNYSITIDDCVNGEEWTVIEKYGTRNDSFAQSKFADEYLWTVIGRTTNVELGFRCTGVYSGSSFTEVKFINIDFIHEPNEDRMPNGEGFCVSGVINEKFGSSYEHTQMLRDDNFCNNWNENKTQIMLRNAAREITNTPGLSTYSTANAYLEFCNTFFAPRYNSVEACQSAFMNANDVRGVIRAFCQAVTTTSNACIDQLETAAELLGYRGAFEQGRETYIETFEDFCTISADDLTDDLIETNLFDECVSGVLIQYNETGSGWKTYKAIPGNFAPCRGIKVSFTYRTPAQRVLFEYPVRILQKYLPDKCTVCDTIAEVDIWMQYN